MELISGLVKGYLGLGLVVLAVQTGLIPVMPELECPGLVQHTLTDRYFPPVDDATVLLKALTGEKDITDTSLVFRVALHVARWVPDLVQHVGMGEMSPGDYLRGGSRCTTIGVIPWNQ